MQRIMLLVVLMTNPAFAAEQVPIGQARSEPADWNSLYKGSFSDSGEEPQTVSEVVAEGNDQLLLGVTSLPVMVTFGPRPPEGSASPSVELPSADLRASVTLELGSCQMLVRTGPIQVAHYEQNNGSVSVLRDSLPPRTELTAPSAGKIFLAANAELSLEIPESSREKCKQQFAGRFVPLGYFSLASSKIEYVEANDRSLLVGQSITQDPPEQLFLMWPTGLELPMLLDNQGTHPDIETGVRQLSHVGAGHGVIRVKPQLEKVSDGLAQAGMPGRLQALWQDQAAAAAAAKSNLPVQ